MKELLKKCLSWILIIALSIPVITSVMIAGDEAEVVEASDDANNTYGYSDLTGDDKGHTANDLYTNYIGQSNMIFTKNKDQRFIYFGYKVKQHSSGSSYVYESLAIRFEVSVGDTSMSVILTKPDTKNDKTSKIRLVATQSGVKEDGVSKEVGVYRLSYKGLSEVCKAKDSKTWAKIFNGGTGSEKISVSAAAVMITKPLNSSGGYTPIITATEKDNGYEVTYKAASGYSTSDRCELWTSEGQSKFVSTWNSLNGHGDSIAANYHWSGAILNPIYTFKGRVKNLTTVTESTAYTLKASKKTADLYVLKNSNIANTDCADSICYGNLYGEADGKTANNSLVFFKFADNGLWHQTLVSVKKRTERAFLSTKSEDETRTIKEGMTISDMLDRYDIARNADDDGAVTTYTIQYTSKQEKNAYIHYYEWDGNNWIQAANTSKFKLDEGVTSVASYDGKMAKNGIVFQGWSYDGGNMTQYSPGDKITTSDLNAANLPFAQTLEDDGCINLYAVFSNKAYSVTLVNYPQDNMKDKDGKYYTLSDANETLDCAAEGYDSDTSTFYEIYTTGLSRKNCSSTSYNTKSFTLSDTLVTTKGTYYVNTPYITSPVYIDNGTNSGTTDWTNVFEFEGYYTETNGNGVKVIDSDGKILTSESGVFGESNDDGTASFTGSSDIILYSYFEVKPSANNNYKVSYDSLFSGTTNNSLKYGSTISLNTDTTSNYNFTFNSYRQLYTSSGLPIYISGGINATGTGNNTTQSYVYYDKKYSNSSGGESGSGTEKGISLSNVTTLPVSSNKTSYQEYLWQNFKSYVGNDKFLSNHNLALFSAWTDMTDPTITLPARNSLSSKDIIGDSNYNDGWTQSLPIKLSVNVADNESGISKYSYSISKYELGTITESSINKTISRSLATSTSTSAESGEFCGTDTTSFTTCKDIKGNTVNYATGNQTSNKSKSLDFTFNSEGIYIIDISVADNANKISTDGEILSDGHIYIGKGSANTEGRHIVVKVDSTAPAGYIDNTGKDGSYHISVAVTDEIPITN